MVLGIDPGLATLGYGLIKDDGSRMICLEYGVIRTSAQEEIPLRLLHLYQKTSVLLERYQPRWMAVEKLFFNRNVKTAFQVGQARGVVVLAAAVAGVEVCEYSPLEIKKAITGYGQAYKGQVQEMVKALLGLQEIPKPDDAADALAVALCHMQMYSYRSRLEGKL